MALGKGDGRKHCHSTNVISLARVLFHAFSKLRRRAGSPTANAVWMEDALRQKTIRR